jgi:hypothetical protein
MSHINANDIVLLGISLLGALGLSFLIFWSLGWLGRPEV